MKPQQPSGTSEGRLAVARHLELLRDEEAARPPEARRSEDQLRQVARARWHNGDLTPEGIYTDYEGLGTYGGAGPGTVRTPSEVYPQGDRATHDDSAYLTHYFTVNGPNSVAENEAFAAKHAAFAAEQQAFLREIKSRQIEMDAKLNRLAPQAGGPDSTATLRRDVRALSTFEPDADRYSIVEPMPPVQRRQPFNGLTPASIRRMAPSTQQDLIRTGVLTADDIDAAYDALGER